MALTVVILDGYTDEPAGLGVPPYIDVYPRYIAGAFWEYGGEARIYYYTIDSARKDMRGFLEKANSSHYTFVVAGVIVPGRYYGGKPLSPSEAIELARLLTNTCSVLVGPAASFGMGYSGGKPAFPPSRLKKEYCFTVHGDPDAFVKDLLREGRERAREWARRKSYDELRRVAVRGASIVKQHPNYGYNLIAELETYRGCSRWVSGGCSFCAEPLYGRPVQRNPMDVVLEAAALYREGVRAFRLGRQADILVYGSKEIGEKEFPKPNPDFLGEFMARMRGAIGGSLLHIDNVNPATISLYPRESSKALAHIIRYHTPGDVAALGVESADEKVIEKNNLNSSPEDALTAIRIINKLGGERGDNGLPHLLPGINFIVGLPGETKETFQKNLDFLERIKREGLLLRRINIRKVLVLPGTRLSHWWKESILSRHEKYISRFKWVVRNRYDRYFLSKVVPKGTVLKNVFIEGIENDYSFGRQQGSYPIAVYVKEKFHPPCIIDVVVKGYKPRSVIGEPIGSCRSRLPVTG